MKHEGYRILARNFRNKLGEIDIVAADKETICFVEVRTRSKIDKHAEALASVDHFKQLRLSRMAVSFLKRHDWLGRSARFDVVSVFLTARGADIVLLKDAFPVQGKYS